MRTAIFAVLALGLVAQLAMAGPSPPPPKASRPPTADGRAPTKDSRSLSFGGAYQWYGYRHWVGQNYLDHWAYTNETAEGQGRVPPPGQPGGINLNDRRADFRADIMLAVSIWSKIGSNFMYIPTELANYPIRSIVTRISPTTGNEQRDPRSYLEWYMEQADTPTVQLDREPTTWWSNEPWLPFKWDISAYACNLTRMALNGITGDARRTQWTESRGSRTFLCSYIEKFDRTAPPPPSPPLPPPPAPPTPPAQPAGSISPPPSPP
eukprot:CAMPEP_0202857790 /NCGR_PEP_ID=MMETSP1391-20130828/590_1 /ASSEMBLY_ACC=CAM_ASM_000867 /TAXON_ID=1034604 /ORGANISM="Chlamydomonas leiostraca, Strain SAG 11-49" /LENGTH=264 /DNA_ID=CAMNT_0049536639 /DNA_START=227 /DNA_END=1017 /DNA_ORIENTATION=+